LQKFLIRDDWWINEIVSIFLNNSRKGKRRRIWHGRDLVEITVSAATYVISFFFWQGRDLVC
jgi:hypothetical protein